MKKLVIISLLLFGVSVTSFSEKKVVVSYDKSQIALVDATEKIAPCFYSLTVDTLQVYSVEKNARPFITVPTAFQLINSGKTNLPNDVKNGYVLSKTTKRSLFLTNNEVRYDSYRVEGGGKNKIILVIFILFISYVLIAIFLSEATPNNLFIKSIGLILLFFITLIGFSEIMFGVVILKECIAITLVISVFLILQLFLFRTKIRFNYLQKERFYCVHTDGNGIKIMRRPGNPHEEEVILVNKDCKILKNNEFDRVITLGPGNDLAVVSNSKDKNSSGLVRLTSGYEIEWILPQEFKNIYMEAGFIIASDKRGYCSIFSLKKNTFIMEFVDAQLVFDEENFIVEIRHEAGMIDHVNPYELEDSIK